MATYNPINSTLANDFVNGTEGSDSIKVYGNHTTVNAAGGDDLISVNGGRHDNGIWLDGDETNLVYAGAGNDSIYVQSRGSSIYGEAGNDTIYVDRAYTYANGGDGNDLFYFNPGYNSGTLNNITVAGGAGTDTIEIRPYTYTTNIVVADFSNDDVIRIDSYHDYNDTSTGYRSNRVITQQVVGGNVVISDNSSVYSYDGDTTEYTVDPNFSITLQGVSDISQVANAKYYRYDGTSPQDYRTLGDLFGVSYSPAQTVPSNTDTGTTTVPSGTDTGTTVTPAVNTDTVLPSPTVTPEPTPTVPAVVTTPSSSANAYVYSGGNVTLSATESYYSSVKGGYTTYDQVNFTTDLLSFGISGDNISINSSSGTLKLSNTRGKYLNYADGNGNPFAYSYIGVNGSSSNGSVGNSYSTVNNSYNTINDKSRTAYGVVIGGDNLNDIIYAGSGGSSLWGGGGSGSNDTLVGGSGVDEFVYKLGNGNDVIQGASSSDFVNLEGIKLSQITSVDTSAGVVSAKFSDGGSVKIEGTEAVGIRVDGWTVAYDHSSGNWQIK